MHRFGPYRRPHRNSNTISDRNRPSCFCARPSLDQIRIRRTIQSLARGAAREREREMEREGGGVKMEKRSMGNPPEEMVVKDLEFREEEEDDDEGLASFLESEILCGSNPDPNPNPSLDADADADADEQKKDAHGDGVSEDDNSTISSNEEEEDAKDDGGGEEEDGVNNNSNNKRGQCQRLDDGEGSSRGNKRKRRRRDVNVRAAAPQIESGAFSKIPPELFFHIFKFLSSEDLVSCALTCRFMNTTASDDTLWRRLYCMRWPLRSAGSMRTSGWKKLYIQRDKQDMRVFALTTQSEFKEYYIQMQAAKRSQAPLPSQVNDDNMILDRTIADQVSIWKKSRGLTDEATKGHYCSGNKCSYHQIGDVFICEKTGCVHVCDDTCREVVADEGILVCTISGLCSGGRLCASYSDDDEQQGGVTDEAEPFMGDGLSARAFQRGYEMDEKEMLEVTFGMGFEWDGEEDLEAADWRLR